MKLPIAFFLLMPVLFGFWQAKRTTKIPFGCWRHSHEEDQANPNLPQKTYRTCSFPFPPARGRSGFILKPDGEIGLTGPTAVDGQDTTWGSWVLIGKNELKLAFEKTKISRLKWKLMGKKKVQIELN